MPADAPERRCPVPHDSLSPTAHDESSDRRSGPAGRRAGASQDASGVWHLHDYAAARALLRATGTRQAGFMAERLDRLPKTMRDPILFQEGDEHREQRGQIARFFTPKTTDERYRGFMERFADEALTELRGRGRADLSAMSREMAVQVAAQVVGLTDSSRPGMASRIEAFFAQAPERASLPRRLALWLRTQWTVGRFFALDVRPAIRARKRAPREDLISHLLAKGYRPGEVLTECVTFAAAGMATTREFIAMAAWHLLERPELRARYLAGDENERYKLLHEVLRLEPVVGTLYRRTLQPLTLPDGLTLPAGAKIALEVYDANADPEVVGAEPLGLCAERALPRGVPDAVLGFGDGHHRCPGAYIAVQESDIFLRKLFELPDLRLERGPTVSYNAVVRGYELREMIVAFG